MIPLADIVGGRLYLTCRAANEAFRARWRRDGRRRRAREYNIDYEYWDADAPPPWHWTLRRGDIINGPVYYIWSGTEAEKLPTDYIDRPAIPPSYDAMEFGTVWYWERTGVRGLLIQSGDYSIENKFLRLITLWKLSHRHTGRILFVAQTFGNFMWPPIGIIAVAPHMMSPYTTDPELQEIGVTADNLTAEAIQ